MKEFAEMEKLELATATYETYFKFMDMAEEYSQEHPENEEEMNILETALLALAGMNETIGRLTATIDTLQTRLVEEMDIPNGNN